MMMNRFIKSIISFCVYSAVFYSLALIIWTGFVPNNFPRINAPYPIGAKGFTFSRMEELKSVKNIDILFLGSSHAYRGFDSRIYADKNIKSFNLGSPSQSPIQTKLLIENFIDQCNPKLVIYEVYPASFQNDGVESALDIIANSESLSNTLSMALNINHLKVYNAFIIDLYRSLFNLNVGFKEVPKKGNDAYINGGFVETNLNFNQSPITAKTKALWAGKKWQLKNKQLEAFEELLILLKEKNINLWLVQTPVTSEAYNLYTNNEYIDSLFSSKSTYFNFNNSLKLDDHFDFADYHHLNQRGVNKVNNELIELIFQREKYFQDLKEKIE